MSFLLRCVLCTVFLVNPVFSAYFKCKLKEDVPLVVRRRIELSLPKASVQVGNASKKVLNVVGERLQGVEVQTLEVSVSFGQAAITAPKPSLSRFFKHLINQPDKHDADKGPCLGYILSQRDILLEAITFKTPVHQDIKSLLEERSSTIRLTFLEEACDEQKEDEVAVEEVPKGWIKSEEYPDHYTHSSFKGDWVLSVSHPVSEEASESWMFTLRHPAPQDWHGALKAWSSLGDGAIEAFNTKEEAMLQAEQQLTANAEAVYATLFG